MKARIKATGEIIKVADYATITLDDHDSWGNPIEVKPEEIELIQEVSKDEHWQEVRERAAIAAMQGTIAMLNNSNRYVFREVVVEGFSGNEKTYPNEIVEFSIACADALVKQLKEE